MQILTSQQLSQVDQQTIKEQHISSWELMERASLAATQNLLKYISKAQHQIVILAGNRNNGGDGLAIAYHLNNSGFNVKVFVFNYASQASDDFQKNRNRLKSYLITDVTKATDFPELTQNHIIIDAIFGVGLNRRLPVIVDNWIDFINSSVAQVLAIDVPSGMYLDRLPAEDEKLIQADKTFTLQLPKLPMLFSTTGIACGDIEIVDIGLTENAIDKTDAKIHYSEREMIRKLISHRHRFSHKGTFGHALLVGGSYGMNGSISLSAEACMRSGVGKTTCKVPKSAVNILQQNVPEVMCQSSKSKKIIDFEADLDAFQAIGIGVGIGTKSKVKTAFAQYVRQAKQPLVIDADGINCLAKSKDLLHQIPGNSILTPHPGEMSRLIQLSKDPFKSTKAIRAFAAKYQIIIVYKNAYTLITDGKSAYFNSTGNAGMATAGSGDVLTGLITGLLAQSYQPLNAALVGVYLHGLAGDLAKSHQGEHALLSRDIIKHLGQAFLELDL